MVRVISIRSQAPGTASHLRSLDASLASAQYKPLETIRRGMYLVGCREAWQRMLKLIKSKQPKNVLSPDAAEAVEPPNPVQKLVAHGIGMAPLCVWLDALQLAVVGTTEATGRGKLLPGSLCRSWGSAKFTWTLPG